MVIFREIPLVGVSVENVSRMYIYIYIYIPLKTTAPAETATDTDPKISEPSLTDTHVDSSNTTIATATHTVITIISTTMRNSHEFSSLLIHDAINHLRVIGKITFAESAHLDDSP